MLKIVIHKFNSSNFKMVINNEIIIENISCEKIIDYINNVPGIDTYICDKTNLIDRSKVISATFLN